MIKKMVTDLLIGLAFVFTFFLTVRGQCIDSFELHGERCYKVSALEASWIESKQYCRLLGSELLVVETEEEEKIIEGILTRIHGSHIDEEYWISGSDMLEEAKWQWFQTDGVNFPVNYTNWGTGVPDNIGGNENCLLIHYRGARTFWNDKRCNELHSFICESVYELPGGQLVG